MDAVRMLRNVALTAGLAAALLGAGALHTLDPHIGPRVRPRAIGATFMPPAQALRAPAGLVVSSLRLGGAAQRGGLRVGDRIDAVNGHPVRSPADVERADLERDAGRGPLVLGLHRGGKAMLLTIASGKD